MRSNSRARHNAAETESSSISLKMASRLVGPAIDGRSVSGAPENSGNLTPSRPVFWSIPLGSKWFTGGVSSAPRSRIQFDFKLEGIRYRPTLRRPPSEANLRLAREHLRSIKQQIVVGTFSFPNEFPDYRYLRRVVGSASVRFCDEVFDEFLTHCESRVCRNDMASVTLRSYRKVLDGVWRPALGKHLFHQVRYSHLVRASDWQQWSKKTYNNAISVIRRAFEFGYRDHPELPNPRRVFGRCA